IMLIAFAVWMGSTALVWTADAPTATSPAEAAHASAVWQAPSTAANRASPHAMMAAMDPPYPGDSAVRFLQGDVPDHEGAVAMDEIALAHGRDAEVQQLAHEVVDAQEREIAQMRRWLERRARSGQP